MATLYDFRVWHKDEMTPDEAFVRLNPQIMSAVQDANEKGVYLKNIKVFYERCRTPEECEAVPSNALDPHLYHVTAEVE
jgi:hypothetical protein